MSDPLTPPPRRPAPEHLRNAIARALDQAPHSRRVRLRSVLIPLAAASLIGASVVGASMLGGRPTPGPVQTASPYPTTASPTTPPTRPTADPSTATTKPSASLDVRPMTRAEIAADTKACRRSGGPEDQTPRRGTVKTQYAMVQARAGMAGPGSQQTRVLVVRDAAGTWVCENGDVTQWIPGGRSAPGLTSSVPAAQVLNNGGFSISCGGGTSESSTQELFAVGDQVAVGRTRLNQGKVKGAWQMSGPNRGFVHFGLVLEGEAAKAASVSMEFQFLDADGDQVSIQPQPADGSGPSTTKTVEVDFVNCADVTDMRRPKPKVIKRPVSDEAGVRTCLAMAKESASNSEVPFTSRWAARLVISTSQRWGAVLSDGQNLVGCSLYPTKEISPFSADRSKISKASFFFAVNPIDISGGSSLWAAGRVPTDVSAITYRLPGNREVAATIDDDGYWMLMYHTDGVDIAEGNVATWEPVVVSVIRPAGTEKFTIKFNIDSMCKQVSHGC
jgi:hypothetical protein